MVWDINLFNKNSIFFTLGISFIVSIVLLVISFITITQIDKTVQIDTLKKKYATIHKIINQEYSRFGFTDDLRYLIDDMGLILVDDTQAIQNILETIDLKLLVQKRSENILLYIFQSKKDNFLHFQTPFEEFIVIDKDIELLQLNIIILLIFLVLLLTILLIAYWVYKKLLPLNELKEKINNIGNKDLQLDFLKPNAKDEVSLLAFALLEKSQNINTLKNARDVFIRNIMHELKTPITKGRFLIELPETTNNKEKLQKVFYHLESLINEFALIEEVMVKKENIEKKEIFFDDILENALDILMIEDQNKVNCNDNKLKLNVNFKLFSILVKNLIDNGLKYSNDKKVIIAVKDETISFSNIGEPLTHSLEKYYEPFFQHSQNNTKQKESFGLGFYIIKSILDAHNFQLKYDYDFIQKENKFTLF